MSEVAFTTSSSLTFFSCVNFIEGGFYSISNWPGWECGSVDALPYWILIYDLSKELTLGSAVSLMFLFNSRPTRIYLYWTGRVPFLFSSCCHAPWNIMTHDTTKTNDTLFLPDFRCYRDRISILTISWKFHYSLCVAPLPIWVFIPVYSLRAFFLYICVFAFVFSLFFSSWTGRPAK